jgi:hypothetical protein
MTATTTQTACVLIFGCLAVTAACGQDGKLESVERLYKQESTGLRHYDRGNYEKAFENLSTTAARGFKESQYILAFMFLKGQHVKSSLVLGMGWLGVAIESEEPEWVGINPSINALRRNNGSLSTSKCHSTLSSSGW